MVAQARGWPFTVGLLTPLQEEPMASSRLIKQGVNKWGEYPNTMAAFRQKSS